MKPTEKTEVEVLMGKQEVGLALMARLEDSLEGKVPMEAAQDRKVILIPTTLQILMIVNINV